MRILQTIRRRQSTFRGRHHRKLPRRWCQYVPFPSSHTTQSDGPYAPFWANNYLMLLAALLCVSPKLPTHVPTGFFMHTAFPSSETFRCRQSGNRNGRVSRSDSNSNIILIPSHPQQTRWPSSSAGQRTLKEHGGNWQASWTSSHLTSLHKYGLSHKSRKLLHWNRSKSVQEGNIGFEKFSQWNGGTA